MTIIEELLSVESERRTCKAHGDNAVWFKPMFEDVMVCNACFREKNQAESKIKFEQEMRELAEKNRQLKVENAHFKACVPPKFESKTFDSYDANTAEKVKVLSACKRFIPAIEKGANMILSGQKGTGKTHLGASIVNEYLSIGLNNTALFTKASKVLSYIRESNSFESEGTRTDAINYFTEFDLLVIDELGRHRATETAVNDLFEVIDERYDAGKSTVIISNKVPDEITKHITESGMDRLQEYGGVLKFDWSSHRQGGVA